MGARTVAGVVIGVLAMGFLVGGSVLIWQSTIQATCNDWQQVTGYVGTVCTTTALSGCFGCTSYCTCHNPGNCVPLLCPSGVPNVGISVPYFVPGLFMLLLGLTGAIIAAVFLLWR
jgi:hypothetical protein